MQASLTTLPPQRAWVKSRALIPELPDTVSVLAFQICNVSDNRMRALEFRCGGGYSPRYLILTSDERERKYRVSRTQQPQFRPRCARSLAPCHHGGMRGIRDWPMVYEFRRRFGTHANRTFDQGPTPPAIQ